MRIVHVSDCYPPRLGGIETQVHGLASRQAAGGDDVHVVTATPGPDGKDGVQLHRLVAAMPFDLPLHPRVVPLVRRLLTALQPDVVHVHGGVISPFSYPAATVAAHLGLPTVITIHGIWGPLAGPVAALSDRLLNWSSLGIVLSGVSDAAADPIRAITEPVYLLPNGIDVDGWRVDHVPGDPYLTRAVAVMRLAPRKRGKPLLDIVNAADTRIGRKRRLQLRVVGDGPARRVLESYATRHQIPATFAGRLARDDIKAELANSDVFLAPATRESFGIAALEARTAGLPVVARREAGIASFVRDGQEGLLVGNDSEFVDALARLCVDVGLRDQIAAHNRTTRPAQDWPVVLDTAFGLYAMAARR